MMEKAQIPEMWKAAKVTPLYKRGIVLDANNYRMLAVSGTMYRLYVNVLRVYVSERCQDITNRRTIGYLTRNLVSIQTGTLSSPCSSSDICYMLRKQKTSWLA